MSTKDYKCIIISDGLPTISKSIEYAEKIGYKNILLISIKPKEIIEKKYGIANIKSINIFRNYNINLLKIIKNCEIIIFSDICSCPSTYFMIKKLSKSIAKTNCIYIKKQAEPYIERDLKDYILRPSGLKKYDISSIIKVILKLLIIKLFDLPVKFLSFANCKVTFLAPNYSVLSNLRTIKVFPNYKKFSPIKNNNFNRIVYLFGGPDELLSIGKLGFFNLIKTIEYILFLNKKSIIHLKLHPNHDCSGFLKLFDKKFSRELKYKIIEKEFDFSKDLTLGTTSSAIYDIDTLSAINLFSLIKDPRSKNSHNIVDIKSYHKANEEFFNHPKHIYKPENIDELKNYFDRKF